VEDKDMEKYLAKLKKLARSNPNIIDHDQNDKDIEAFYIQQGDYIDVFLGEANRH
jgi:hypothetical protein